MAPGLARAVSHHIDVAGGAFHDGWTFGPLHIMRGHPYLPVLFAALLISGCGAGPELGPKRVSLSDTNVAPMLKAIAAADRDAFGFTPIPTNADIRLELGPRPGYDAMLHIYGGTHHTIAFRKTAGGFRWIAEQEIYYGPKMFTDVDGTFQEHLVVEYQTEPVNGIPTNQIHVSYYGQDARLAGRDLTLEGIQPFLKEWKGTPIR